MRVLQINSVCGVGSTGRIATDLYNEFKKNGHECCIAYGRGKAPNEYNTIKIGNKFDIAIHGFLSRTFDMHGIGSYFSTNRLIKKINKFNPDVIHIHNLHGYYINIKVLFRYLKKIEKPIIWTLHDCWAFTGHCSHFQYISCEKWKEQCTNCPQFKSYPKSLFYDNSFRNYKLKREIFCGIKNMTIVTPSKWLEDLVKQSFLKEYPIRVINNGIDLDVFNPSESDFKNKYGIGDKIIVLGVANVWNIKKGYDDFLKLRKLLDDNFTIVLVGLNDNQIKSLPKGIIGIKRTNNVRELAELYTCADVFVNPTYEDNFPTVNIEALACGTPVITYNTGGSGECIDNKCGIIIYEKTAEKLAETIIDFQRNKYGSDVISACAKKYDIKKFNEKYLLLYEEVRDGKK